MVLTDTVQTTAHTAATRTCRDPHLAADVEQATLLAILESGKTQRTPAEVWTITRAQRALALSEANGVRPAEGHAHARYQRAAEAAEQAAGRSLTPAEQDALAARVRAERAAATHQAIRQDYWYDGGRLVSLDQDPSAATEAAWDVYPCLAETPERPALSDALHEQIDVACTTKRQQATVAEQFAALSALLTLHGCPPVVHNTLRHDEVTAMRKTITAAGGMRRVVQLAATDPTHAAVAAVFRVHDAHDDTQRDAVLRVWRQMLAVAPDEDTDRLFAKVVCGHADAKTA